MDKKEVVCKVCELMEECFGESFFDLTECSSFYYEAGLDSLDFLELVDAVEKEYCISLPEEALENWKTAPLTLGGFADLICETAGR